MSAQVIPLFSCRARGWSSVELAEFVRAKESLGRAGIDIELAQGVSDEGDPWVAFCLEPTGDVVVHIARIGAQYVVEAPGLGRKATGPSFNRLVADFLRTHPFFVDGRARANGGVSLHPGALLLGLLLACVARMHQADAHEVTGELVKRTVSGVAPAAADLRGPRGSPAAALSPITRDFGTMPAITSDLLSSSTLQNLVLPDLKSEGSVEFIGGVVIAASGRTHASPLTFGADAATHPALVEFRGSFSDHLILAQPFSFPTERHLPLPEEIVGRWSFRQAVTIESSTTVHFSLPSVAAGMSLVGLKTLIENTSSIGLAAPHTPPQPGSPAATPPGFSALVAAPSPAFGSSDSIPTDAVSAQGGAATPTIAHAAVSDQVDFAGSHQPDPQNKVVGQLAAVLSSATSQGHAEIVAPAVAASNGSSVENISHTKPVGDSAPPADPLHATSSAADGPLADVAEVGVARFIAAHPDYQVLSIGKEVILFDPVDLSGGMHQGPPVESFVFSDGSSIALVGIMPAIATAPSHV